MSAKMTARLSSPLIAFCLVAAAASNAQVNNYRQVNLVSNVPGLALIRDPNLQNPWGIAVSNGQPFRITNNASGDFRSYDGNGASHDFAGIIDVPGGVSAIPKPTGVAANPTNLFVPSTSQSTPFIFATEDGTISTEYADTRGDIKTTTILVVNRSANGTVYTGLAVLTPGCCNPFLAAVDFHGGSIDTFTSNFNALGIPGAFTDPNLPAGYAPYNINIVGNQLFITYALQDAAKHDPVIGTGNGIVDVYDLAGTFVKRFVSNGALNAPWAVVKASANFGAFSNDILIGNFGDGVINAFDPASGRFLGSLEQGNGNAIVDFGLHGMVFGDGVTGDQNTLYIATGLAGGTGGVFGAISVNAGGATPDFSLHASGSTATVAPGQSANFSLTATPVGDFRGLFAWSCDAPTGITCTVGNNSVNQVTGAATVMLTVTPSATGQFVSAAGLAFPGFLVAGMGIWGRMRRGRKQLVGSFKGSNFWMIAIAASGLGLFGMMGCGSAYNAMPTPTGGTASITVTASSASISHSTTLTLTVQ